MTYKNSDDFYGGDLPDVDFDKMKLISYCKFHSIIILAGTLVRYEALLLRLLNYFYHFKAIYYWTLESLIMSKNEN